MVILQEWDYAIGFYFNKMLYFKLIISTELESNLIDEHTVLQERFHFDTMILIVD